MFTLTPFAPTATPGARPIPPLPSERSVPTPAPLPYWLAALSPPANGTVSLDAFEGICLQLDSYVLDNYPALLDLFRAKERVRDHLYLRVNGIIPSELTWQHIIIPNSTNPGTAWIGVRAHTRFCWPVDLTTGRYEAQLTYPAESGSETYVWHFVVK
jgi:hypothetical protein